MTWWRHDDVKRWKLDVARSLIGSLVLWSQSNFVWHLLPPRLTSRLKVYWIKIYRWWSLQTDRNLGEEEALEYTQYRHIIPAFSSSLSTKLSPLTPTLFSVSGSRHRFLGVAMTRRSSPISDCTTFLSVPPKRLTNVCETWLSNIRSKLSRSGKSKSSESRISDRQKV